MTAEIVLIILGLINVGFSFYNYFRMESIEKTMNRERFCRYPDTDVRDILIDYELEKAKKLDKAIHQVEDIEKKI